LRIRYWKVTLMKFLKDFKLQICYIKTPNWCFSFGYFYDIIVFIIV